MSEKKTNKSIQMYARTHAGRVIKLIVGKNTVLPIVAGRLKGKKWIAGAGIEQALGIWKERYMDRFEESIYESSVVYDVGANGGWYTLLASELVGQVGKVVAFEPLAPAARYLKRNVDVNQCTNVQIVEAAVSDSDGTATFFEEADGTLGSLSPIYGHHATTVKTIKIDSLVKKNLAPAPNFVKMDIERGELAALKGAEKTFVEHAPMIFLETHGHDMYVDCCSLLDSMGYELERIHNSRSIVALKRPT